MPDENELTDTGEHSEDDTTSDELEELQASWLTQINSRLTALENGGAALAQQVTTALADLPSHIQSALASLTAAQPPAAQPPAAQPPAAQPPAAQPPAAQRRPLVVKVHRRQ